jgi:hypothetical protein
MGTPMTYISGNTGAYQSGTFNKGTIALNLNPSSLASGNNWYNGVDVTATQYLIYSDTYSTGIATQANSRPTAWTTPDLSDASLLNLINTLPDRIGLTPFTSLPLALQWLNATNEYFLIKTNFENIVTSGLVLNLDAGWYNSYSGTTTWFDRSGNGNNGTLVNSPTFNGSSQGAIVFDGTDDYVDCGNLSTLNNLTVQMFVNVTSNTGNYRAFAAAKGGSQDYDSGFNIDMMLGSSTSFSNCNIEGGFLRIPGGTNFMQSSVPFGTWCNICFTVSPTYIQFYLNGVPQYGTARLNNASSTIGMNSLSIGRRPIVDSAVNSFINAKISNTQIYNRALSPQEVLQNYNAQKSRFGIYDIVQSGLTLSYDASNYLSYPRSGSTWFDMTSNSGNGSLINGPTFNTGATPSIQFDGSDDTMRTNYNLSQFNTITINFLANAAYINESMAWSLGSGGPDWYIKENTMGYNSYGGDTYGLSTAQINQLGLRNNWHMLTMTYTQNGAIANNKVYVDGIRQTISQQLGTTRSMSFSNIGINFLSAFDNNGYSLNASVGHISVYNRELSEQEIVQNFESLRKQYPVTGYTTSGLTLNLDAGNYASYPTTGTKWVDISGNYNNTTLMNGPVWSNTSGGTITFDGSDDFATITRTNSISPTTAISQESWVNFNSSSDTQVIIGMQLGDSSNNSYALWYQGGQFSGEVGANGNFDNIGYTWVPTVGTWYHLSHTYDGTIQRLYINGVQVQTKNTSGLISYNVNNTKLVIGGDYNSGYDGGLTARMNGKISIVRIYNRALSASEILQNYNALKGRFGL